MIGTVSRISRRAAAAVAAILLFAGGAAAEEPFSLEEVLRAPFSDGLVAAEAADRIAWVVYREGRRNIWTAAAPDFKPLRLTAYEADDGQILGDLQLSADGARLLYVRGSAPNRAGEAANPKSDPEGTAREIWLVATSGEGAPRRLAEGSDPEFAPDGASVVFARSGALYRISLEGEGEPELLFADRGSVSDWRWSPDGAALAFVSTRGAYNFIGIYRPGPETIEWIDPGVNLDLNPVWSPDGTKIAFLRLPGLKKDEWFYLMGAYPFELRVVEVASGAARTLFAAERAQGYYPLSFGLPLHWADDKTLVFQSEHEGHMRFYRIGLAGGLPRRLTDGACETETASAGPSGTAIYISNNCSDVERRDLWRLDVSTGKLAQLTTGDHIEFSPAPLASGDYLAFRASSAQEPAAVHVARADGSGGRRIEHAEWPEGFPAGRLVAPRPVTFEAADGLEVHGVLFDSGAAEKRPAVIFLHGGPIRQMWAAWHSRGYYAMAYALNQYLAARGYVVLALNFRAGIGYGRDYRAVPDHGPRGSSEYQDVVAAGRYLRGLAHVDPGRIGLWGGSYGGTLTGMGLSRNPELFRAGVAFHGVYDWSLRSKRLGSEEGRGGWSIIGDKAQKLAHKSSTVGDLSKWKAPVLLVHGDDDRNVLFEQTVDLVRRLRARGVHVETLILPDEVHGFYLHESWLRAYGATADFLDRYLKE